MTDRDLRSFGRGDSGLITVCLYEDGDVVVCHGPYGGCVTLADRSDYEPLHDLLDEVDLNGEVARDIEAFVTDNADYWA